MKSTLSLLSDAMIIFNSKRREMNLNQPCRVNNQETNCYTLIPILLIFRYCESLFVISLSLSLLLLLLLLLFFSS